MATSILQFDPKVIAYNAARLAHEKMPKEGFSTTKEYTENLTSARDSAATMTQGFMNASTANGFDLSDLNPEIINDGVKQSQQVIGGGMAGVFQLLFGMAGNIIFSIIKAVKTIVAAIKDPNKEPGMAGFFKALPDQWVHQTQMDQISKLARKSGYTDADAFVKQMTKSIDPQKPYNFAPDPAILSTLRKQDMKNAAAQKLADQQQNELLQDEMQTQTIKATFDKLDTNGDGIISKAEGAKEDIKIDDFMKLIDSKPGLKQKVLGAIDTDQNGSISSTEMNNANIGKLQPLYVEATTPVTVTSKAP